MSDAILNYTPPSRFKSLTWTSACAGGLVFVALVFGLLKIAAILHLEDSAARAIQNSQVPGQ